MMSGALEAPFSPNGITLRPAAVEDADAIAHLVNEMFVAEIGEPWTTAEEIRDGLTTPGRDPGFADLLAVDDDGTPVGYLQFYVTRDPLEVSVFPHVVPRWWGRGVSGWLIAVGEERVRERLRSLPDTQATALVARFAENEPARRLFEVLGYRYERTFWMMRIDLTAGTHDPEIPGGIVIRTIGLNRDIRPVYGVLADAFSEHWGGAFDPYEDWRHRHVDGEGSSFDPDLWFVAVDGDEIVGAALCIASSPRDEDAAIVEELGVLSGWRRRGVAQALLRTAFAEFARRGIPRAELGVDADNTTGATRLYERVGMRVAYAWEFWRKELTTAA